MAALEIYEQFLAAPSSAVLADKATLQYITTTTTISGATEILKHLSSLKRQLNKKQQNILFPIDGKNVIALEVDTQIEFLTSGGPYLPGLDDNFLSDRTAHLSIMHIVVFDNAGKIVQMRQQWDQGSLLKQLEIIGKTGRNWPIRDSREQLSMIRSSLESAGLAASSGSIQSHNDVVIRTRGTSANALRDPHASLELFAPREQIETAEPASVVSPYAGSRPRQRGFTEILGDEPHDDDASGGRDRSLSPSKGGQGKNFQPSRIFDGQSPAEDDDDDNESRGSKSYIRPNPRKYEHFEMSHGPDPHEKLKSATAANQRPKSKHDSQWSFDDFVTPQKPKPSKMYRNQASRNWDPDPAHNENLAKAAGQGRREVESHFELQDDGENMPPQQRGHGKPRGFGQNEGLGLYNKNHDDASAGPQRALGNITNLKDRSKDFAPQFVMADDSPSGPQQQQPQALPEGRQKAVKMMDANWSSYDKSPTAHKENQPQQSGTAKDGSRIHIAGDGMGTKKGTGRDFLRVSEPEVKDGICIAGDGMGGKKGTDRNWIFGGGDDDEVEAPPKATMSRKGNEAAAGKSFWGF